MEQIGAALFLFVIHEVAVTRFVIRCEHRNVGEPLNVRQSFRQSHQQILFQKISAIRKILVLHVLDAGKKRQLTLNLFKPFSGHYRHWNLRCIFAALFKFDYNWQKKDSRQSDTNGGNGQLQNDATRRLFFMERTPLFMPVAGFSLAIGLLVPTIFELTEKPAGRSRHPVLERNAVIAILVSIVIAAIIWFVNRPTEQTGEAVAVEPRRPVQFGIRHLLIGMTLVAVLISVSRLMNLDLVMWVVTGVAAGMLVWSLFRGPGVRSRFAALLAAMFLPFVWIIAVSRPFGPVSGMLPGIAFGPGLLSAMLLRRGPIDESVWIAALFVILEMALGYFLASRKKALPFLIYLWLVLLLSAFTSLIFHALYRM